MLGEARRRRGEQRSRVLVLVELQRERRADDLLLVVARDARALHPAPPVVERALEEALGRLLEPGLERLAPREDEVAVAFEQERALVLDVGQRHVRREADRRREARVLDVVRRAPAPDLLQSVLVRRTAANASARLAGQRSHDPDEHRRLEEAVVQREARREVDHLEGAAVAAEHRSHDVRVLDVGRLDQVRIDALDRERAALLAVEQRAEDEARVGARPAEPLDGALLQEGAVGAVPDDGEASSHVQCLSRARNVYLLRPKEGRWHDIRDTTVSSSPATACRSG